MVDEMRRLGRARSKPRVWVGWSFFCGFYLQNYACKFGNDSQLYFREICL